MELLEKEEVAPPKLRFKAARVYRRFLLSELCSFSLGRNIKQGEASPEFETPCVRYGELYHMYGEIIDTVVNRTNLDHSELLFSQGNEILLPSAGEDPMDIGNASALTLKDVAIGRTINILRPLRSDAYDHKYVAYYIREKLRETIAALAQGVSISNVYNTQLRTLEVKLPTLPEQQKIAAFLGVVDRKIQQLKRKQALLEQYKKGVVQQLFAQQLRFKRKDGREFSEWEEKSFGDIYTFYNTNSLSRDKLNYEGGDVLNIHYGDIHTKYAPIFKAENEPVPFINRDVDQSSIPKEQFCQVGDLVIADASEDVTDIGKSIEILSTDGKRIMAGLHTYLARPKKNTMAPGYGAYLMRSLQVRQEIERLAHGTKVMSISRTHLNSINVSLPSLEEQTRIAGFLMALDAKVAGVAQAVEAAQRWKKGLLQQMFV